MSWRDASRRLTRHWASCCSFLVIAALVAALALPAVIVVRAWAQTCTTSGNTTNCEVPNGDSFTYNAAITGAVRGARLQHRQRARTRPAGEGVVDPGEFLRREPQIPGAGVFRRVVGARGFRNREDGGVPN